MSLCIYYFCAPIEPSIINTFDMFILGHFERMKHNVCFCDKINKLNKLIIIYFSDDDVVFLTIGKRQFESLFISINIV